MMDQDLVPLEVAASPVRRSRLRLVPFNQITLGTAPRYLVKGLIPAVGLTIVWGPPKSGKSFWVFDLVMHVVLDRQYRGRRVQTGAVVYCAFEGQTGIEARVEAFRLRHLAEDDPGPVAFYLEPVTLDLVRDHQELITLIRGHERPAVVVLDTLNRSLAGSESSDEDMGAYVRAADAIREAFDCAVVVVHHSGLDQSRPRGHTSLVGAADAQIKVTRDADDTIRAEVELAKDGPQGLTVASRLEVVEVGVDDEGDAITSCIIVEAEAGPPQRSRARITGAARTALDLLVRALADAGEKAPASNHVPPDISVVPVSLWRRYCYEGTISETDTPEARQKAFKRASTALQAAGAIGVWDDFVWAVR